MRTYLAMIPLLLVACSDAPAVKVGERSSAATTYPDNSWSYFVATPPGAKWNSISLTAPQSTGFSTFFAQSQAALAKVCALPCRGAVIEMNLIPSNVWSPPPPDHPYSPASIQHYVDGLNQMSTFLASAGLDAKSTERTIANMATGTVGIRSVVDGVFQKFAKKKQEVIDDASNQLKAMAAPIVGQEKVQLAETKQKTQTLQQITTDYTTAAAALAGDYSLVVSQFKLYRSTEGAVVKEITQVAMDAATADLDALPKLQVQLHDLESTESTVPEQINLMIVRLQKQLKSIQSLYDTRVAPYLTFMQSNGIKAADATSLVLSSLLSMSDYCLGREDRVQKAVAQVNDGLSRRLTALLAQAVDKAVQPTLLASAQLQASTAFVDEINGRLAHLWDKLPTSSNLKLSFLSSKYDEMVALLQFEAICASTPPAYMQTGCLLLKPQFSRARDWIGRTAPSVIRIQAMMLKNAGADATTTAAITAEVNGGQVRQAAFDQDVLLRDTDLPVSVDGGTRWEE